MKAVITGGNGFVGKRLAKALLNKGWEVIVFSRGTSKNSGGIQTVKVNYSDIADLTKNLVGADIVFHLAAVLFANNKQEFEKGNAVLTANLIEAVKRAQTIKHFVYQSSLAAAGPSRNIENLIDENYPCLPVSDYGRTKLMGENEVKKLPPQSPGSLPTRTIFSPYCTYSLSYPTLFSHISPDIAQLISDFPVNHHNQQLLLTDHTRHNFLIRHKNSKYHKRRVWLKSHKFLVDCVPIVYMM